MSACLGIYIHSLSVDCAFFPGEKFTSKSGKKFTYKFSREGEMCTREKLQGSRRGGGGLGEVVGRSDFDSRTTSPHPTLSIQSVFPLKNRKKMSVGKTPFSHQKSTKNAIFVRKMAGNARKTKKIRPYGAKNRKISALRGQKSKNFGPAGQSGKNFFQPQKQRHARTRGGGGPPAGR